MFSTTYFRFCNYKPGTLKKNLRFAHTFNKLTHIDDFTAQFELNTAKSAGNN